VPTPSPRPPLLERLALHRPELRAWALYDWANSAMVTVIVTAVFPIYFEQVAAEGLTDKQSARLLGIATTVSLLATAVAAPVLGAIADYRALRKRFLAFFLLLGLFATAGLFLVGPGDSSLAAVLFGLANVGASGSFVFYDALLPHVARPGELDRVSSSAYSLGYLGGGLLLALNLLWILNPQWFGLPSGEGLTPAEATLPTRLAFLSVALWWAVFSIPLLWRVPEPPRQLESDERPGDRVLGTALRRLAETFRELRRYRQAFLMMVAFLLYNDGIGTIIRMAGFFGAQLELNRNFLIASILVVQIVGVPCALVFGKLAARLGAKRAITIGVLAYLAITVLAFGMRTEAHFLALAFAVGAVQGGTQALSRSLFASLIPRHKATEFFALFAVLEKFAGVLGPATFTLLVEHVDEPRFAILSILPFFIGGAWVLQRVDVAAGRVAARAAEEDLTGPPANSAADQPSRQSS
jgi:UMF1 family MFS transporter